MKTFTITVQSEKDAEQLKRLLREANFKAELVAWEDDEFTSEEITMLEERLEEYRKDPTKGKTLEEVKEYFEKRLN
ncbi:MAG: hypothetical protein U0T75_09170 [Chitinophagales bacterium]